MEYYPASFNFGTQAFEEWPGNWQYNRFEVPGNYNPLNCWSPYIGQCANITWPAKYTTGAYQVRVKGGGGSVNGALHQLPHANMFQGGPYSGWPAWPKGWNETELAPYYEEVQRALHLTTTPSADGRHYLDTSGANQFRSVISGPCASCAAYPDGLSNASTIQPSNGTFGIPFVSAYQGLRESTANVLLKKALRSFSNLDLLLRSEVTEVLHTKGTASGVSFTREGREYKAKLTKSGRVVMCAGAFNTPRLLMYSGIKNHGLGKNLSDHTMTVQTYEMSPEWLIFPYTRNLLPGSITISKEIAWLSGGLAQFGPTLTAFVRDPTTAGTEKDYDVEIFVQPQGSTTQLMVYFILMRPTCSSTNLYLEGDTLMKGSGLYFACERDVKTMQFAQDFVQQRMEKQKKTAKCVDNCGSVLNATVNSVNHWSGTCALGRCVCPKKLLVHGTTNIAVADASLLPGQIWGHPAYTMEAVALRAADLIIASVPDLVRTQV